MEEQSRAEQEGVIFIVTEYGCNSGAHCMWPPKSRTFTTHAAAYQHFLQVSPALDDPDNKAQQCVHPEEEYKKALARSQYAIIEERAHTPGYLDGDGLCSKRPRGAVFAASILGGKKIPRSGIEPDSSVLLT
jgi:hypothetical protein